MPEGIISRLIHYLIFYLTITSDADVDHLQEDLDKLVEWERQWKMVFHPEKFNELIIIRKRV